MSRKAPGFLLYIEVPHSNCQHCHSGHIGRVPENLADAEIGKGIGELRDHLNDLQHYDRSKANRARPR